MCGRAIWTATPSAAALSHAEMQAFRRNARFARYSRGNRRRLRLPLASQNQASLRESRPQGVTIPNADAEGKCYFRFSMKEFRRVSLICLLDIRRILAQAKASSLFSKPFSLAAIKMPIVPVIRSFIVVATCLARTSP